MHPPHIYPSQGIFCSVPLLITRFMCGQNTLILNILQINIYVNRLLTPQQSPPGQQVNEEWLLLTLDYLPVCYTQRSMLTVMYVVCYQSVTRNSINSSGLVYNREFITQPIPISHSPCKINFESDENHTFDNKFISKTYLNLEMIHNLQPVYVHFLHTFAYVLLYVSVMLLQPNNPASY